MTLLEAGFNWNYQKSFLRLLRNKGALAALPLHRKIELARFLCSSQLRVGGACFEQAGGLHMHGVCMRQSLPCDAFGCWQSPVAGHGRLDALFGSSCKQPLCCLHGRPFTLNPSVFFCCSQGYGLTYVLMFARIRLGLHKHAKEGLTCLLESCTQREYERVGTCQLLHCLLRG